MLADFGLEQIALGQQRVGRREGGHLAGERVQHAHHVGDPVEEDEEALRGWPVHLVPVELREVNVPAMAGGDVHESAAVRSGSFFPEHDPLAWVEAAVQDAVLARVRGAETPRTANCAEANVIRDIIGQEALGN